MNILILGASSEIGKEVVGKIEKEIGNCELYLTKYTFADKISKKSCKEFIVDFSNAEALDQFILELSNLEITHLIQLQGIGASNDSIVNLDINLNRRIYRINLEANLLILSKLLDGMAQRNFGRIVLTSTASTKHGGALNNFSYGLSKHGLDYLCLHLAKYYTKYNILTNCVSPGFIDTKIHTKSLKRSEKQLRERVESIRLGRPGAAREVADIIYFLSFENTFISGQNLKVDGCDFI